MENTSIIVLIPAYLPDEKLVQTVRALWEADCETVVVNDGSTADCDEVFAALEGCAVVLRHSENRGKGEAVKTGLRYIRDHFAPPYTVVTADADGQHTVADTLRVAADAAEHPDGMTLGSRRLSGHVPFRSRAGNALTRLVYRLSTGSQVYDTQTGLRAFCDGLIPRLLEIEGSRYEYEMNVLMELAREKTELREVPIDTVYLDGNASSHFHTVRDSARIYREILKFSAASFAGFLVDYGLFTILSAATGAVVFSNICARIVSGTVNFTLNRRVVFRSKEHIVRAAAKYIALALLVIVLNTLLLKGLTLLGMNVYLAKILTELVLFVFNYLVQRLFVFRKERTHT